MGHSAGGLSITQACHKFSKKIRLAVYLAATMLKLGYQTEEDMKDVNPFHSNCYVLYCFTVSSLLIGLA